ncbi:hypothetical protein Q6348_14155 [Isoptericola sp. b441]|uniref:Uncharacterized protein n=1 Tax=Actinotalea lenta TaxID=3064654 RepID=A0ABT9DBS8_9CELL|nr:MULTISPECIES: hypothetical protein [unclassified Isoptericola]MDO8108337.1 hypothetical protein [Isoptericola sp. b441]MDO8119737.1 hypothetical protein [Isoptericola sp. b490]
MSKAGALDPSALPVRCEDWEVVDLYAFDRVRDPRSLADVADSPLDALIPTLAPPAASDVRTSP